MGRRGAVVPSAPRTTCACGNLGKRCRSGQYVYWSKKCGTCLKSPEAARQRRDSCEGCGYRPVTPELLEVDHILPRARGGDNSRRNLQALCANCHKIKTLLDRLPDHPGREEMLAGKHIQLASAVQQKLLQIA